MGFRSRVLLLLSSLAVGALFWARRSDPSPQQHHEPAASEVARPGPHKTRARAQDGSRETPAALDREHSSPEGQAERRRGPAPLPEEAPELIHAALHSPEPESRIRAVAELGWLEPTPEIVRACVELLKDSDADVRAQVVLALEQYEDPRSLPLLEELAETDPDLSVRSAATHAARFLRGSQSTAVP